MATDEDFEQLGIEALRARCDLLDLKPRFNVETVAEVTGLEVEIDCADLALLGGFSCFELDTNFAHECGVADAACAWNKTNGNRLATIARSYRSFGRHSPASKNFHDLLRSLRRGYPIGTAGPHQAFVIACRNVLADEDEKHLFTVLRCNAEQTIEIRARVGWPNNQYIRCVVGFSGSVRLDVFEALHLDEVRNDLSDSVFDCGASIGTEIEAQIINRHCIFLITMERWKRGPRR